MNFHQMWILITIYILFIVFSPGYSAWADTGSPSITNSPEYGDFHDTQDPENISDTIRIDNPNPIDATGWRIKGDTLFLLQQYEEAVHAYDNATKLNLSDSIAWAGKGNALSVLKRYEDALQAYTRVIRLNPKNSDAFISKGQIQTALGQNYAALETYKIATRMDPEHIPAMLEKARLYAILMEYYDALKTYDVVTSLDPENYIAWSEKASVLSSLNRFEEAIHAADTAIAINLSDGSAWSEKAYALNALERNEEAINISQTAISLDPSRADNWMNLGYSFDALDLSENATAAYTTAVHLNNSGIHVWSDESGTSDPAEPDPLNFLNTIHAITWRHIGITYAPQDPSQSEVPVLERMKNLEQSLVFIADHDKNSRILMINLNLNEDEINALSDDTNIKEEILRKVQASSISLQALQRLEFRFWDVSKPGSVTKVVYEGQNLKKKIRAIETQS